MSEEKMKRRRFLADLLFAGGSLTAAAFLAKTMSPEAPPPETPPSPIQSSCSPQPLEGDVAMPITPDGAMELPETATPGKMALPETEVNIEGNFVQPR